MAKKKTILTEDLFNANGDTKVSGEVLNESAEITEETKEDDNILENTQDESKETKTLEDTTEIDEIKDNTSDEKNSSKSITDEVNNDTQDKSKETPKITKPIIKKVGFNDESYYYDNLK